MVQTSDLTSVMLKMVPPFSYIIYKVWQKFKRVTERGHFTDEEIELMGDITHQLPTKMEIPDNPSFQHSVIISTVFFVLFHSKVSAAPAMWIALAQASCAHPLLILLLMCQVA